MVKELVWLKVPFDFILNVPFNIFISLLPTETYSKLYYTEMILKIEGRNKKKNCKKCFNKDNYFYKNNANLM